jgi:hypothetical protein
MSFTKYPCFTGLSRNQTHTNLQDDALVILMALALLTAGFKVAGRGENQPTVQSALGGGYYVRTVPSGDTGTEGNTKVFQVKRDGDKLLDDYPSRVTTVRKTT